MKLPVLIVRNQLFFGMAYENLEILSISIGTGVEFFKDNSI